MTTISFLTQLSKSLSYVLRHGAAKQGIKISSDGYALCEDILKLPKFKKYNLDNIKEVVTIDNKQRYKMKEVDGKIYIRANQGHSGDVGKSINEKELLTKITVPLDTVVHGCPLDAYKLIAKSGLKKMNRTHIHFAINDDFIEGNKDQSGIRTNCQVLIYLNMAKAMADGIEFYMSDNKVVLSKGIGEEGLIDTKYFSKVINKMTGDNLI